MEILTLWVILTGKILFPGLCRRDPPLLTILSVVLGPLATVLGAVNVQTSESFDCGPIEDLGTKQVVQGSITCAGKQAVPGGAGSTPTGTGASSSASSTGSATSDASGYLAVDTSSLLLGSSSLIAALLQMFL